jgi:adenosylcobinamide-GDP ribazoletransferase
VNPLRLAFGLLTAVPVGRLPSVDRRSAGAAMLLAPLTTAPLLALVAVAHGAVRLGAPPLLAAGLLVTAGALLSRALHLDGLADTADGLSAGFDAETSLRAMKASDTGPSGVAAVVLAVLLQVASLGALLPTAHGAALAALAWLGSRHSLAWACRRGVPAAQPTGLGALVAGTVGRGGLVVAGGLLALVALGMDTLVQPQESVAPVWQGLAVVAAGLLAAEALLRRCRRRLGGVTGDVLGAGIEVSLTASLVTAALLTTT